MSAANDIVKSRRSWLRRNSESPLRPKVVGDVPPDLANNIDEDGSLVTVDPADWIVCFVPGLRRQWWHRFVHNRHKHVFAMRPTGTGRLVTRGAVVDAHDGDDLTAGRRCQISPVGGDGRYPPSPRSSPG
jgi:hypothetical protein